MTFRDSVLNLVGIAKQKQLSCEVITEEDVVRSFIILNYAKYASIADLFMGCAALNLLNAYVKQDNAQIDYTFRRHMLNVLKAIEDLEIQKKLEVTYDETNQMITFSFWGFMFSFQGERKSELIKRIQHISIPWDGIRKQRCAKTIFDFAINNNYRTDMTLGGNTKLSSMIQDAVIKYQKGKYRFIHGKLICVANWERDKNDRDDEYEKNYIREKLFACQDRPVILTGIFKRVWDRHITFTTIKPYIQGCFTVTICDHINLLREDVEKVYDIQEFERNKRYFIIGRCKSYRRTPMRMGVILDLTFKPSPLFRVHDFHKMPKDVFAECHRFDIEEFRGNQQRHLKL